MIKLDEDIELEMILEIALLYKHKYVTIDAAKGRINYLHETIHYNPMFNEEGQTLVHESLHHYFDNIIGKDVTEKYVEECTLELYSRNPKVCDNLAKRLLGI